MLSSSARMPVRMRTRTRIPVTRARLSSGAGIELDVKVVRVLVLRVRQVVVPVSVVRVALLTSTASDTPSFREKTRVGSVVILSTQKAARRLQFEALVKIQARGVKITLPTAPFAMVRAAQQVAHSLVIDFHRSQHELAVVFLGNREQVFKRTTQNTRLLFRSVKGERLSGTGLSVCEDGEVEASMRFFNLVLQVKKYFWYSCRSFSQAYPYKIEWNDNVRF